jgi:DNA repair exonuclease SbcCD ATPase subunit
MLPAAPGPRVGGATTGPAKAAERWRDAQRARGNVAARGRPADASIAGGVSASKKVREGIQKAQSLRMELARTRQDLEEAKKQLEAIVEDQKRIRANIKELPSSSKAYKRLVDKIDEQEPVVEKHQADIKRLTSLQNTQQKAFDDFLASFTAE